MSRITAHFISDVTGVYTKEIETVNTKERMKSRRSIMLAKWLKIIGGFDDSSDDNITHYNDDEKLELIRREIRNLNEDYKYDQERQFIFYVEKIN